MCSPNVCNVVRVWQERFETTSISSQARHESLWNNNASYFPFRFSNFAPTLKMLFPKRFKQKILVFNVLCRDSLLGVEQLNPPRPTERRVLVIRHTKLPCVTTAWPASSRWNWFVLSVFRSKFTVDNFQAFFLKASSHVTFVGETIQLCNSVSSSQVHCHTFSQPTLLFKWPFELLLQHCSSLLKGGRY